MPSMLLCHAYGVYQFSLCHVSASSLTGSLNGWRFTCHIDVFLLRYRFTLPGAWTRYPRWGCMCPRETVPLSAVLPSSSCQPSRCVP